MGYRSIAIALIQNAKLWLSFRRHSRPLFQERFSHGDAAGHNRLLCKIPCDTGRTNTTFVCTLIPKLTCLINVQYLLISAEFYLFIFQFFFESDSISLFLVQIELGSAGFCHLSAVCLHCVSCLFTFYQLFLFSQLLQNKCESPVK